MPRAKRINIKDVKKDDPIYDANVIESPQEIKKIKKKKENNLIIESIIEDIKSEAKMNEENLTNLKDYIKNSIKNEIKYSSRINPEQFSRNNNSNIRRMETLFKTHRVVIIGLGGIGSWIAKILGNIQDIHLTLFDNDHVDGTNLNRTPFVLTDIGFMKTDVIAAQIIEINPTKSTIIAVPRLFNEETLSDENLKLKMSKDILVFDCRDNSPNDHNLLCKLVNKNAKCRIIICRPAYNRNFLTLDYNAHRTVVHGANGYEVVPSSSILSSLAATLAISTTVSLRNKIPGTEFGFYGFAIGQETIDYEDMYFEDMMYGDYSGGNDKIKNFLKFFIENPITIDLNDLMNILWNGHFINSILNKDKKIDIMADVMSHNSLIRRTDEELSEKKIKLKEMLNERTI